MREVRALLLAIPPLVVDLIRHVVSPRLASSGVALTIVAASDPPPDLVVATEFANLPAGIPAIILSADLALTLGGTPTALTPESLAQRILDII